MSSVRTTHSSLLPFGADLLEGSGDGQDEVESALDGDGAGRPARGLRAGVAAELREPELRIPRDRERADRRIMNAQIGAS
jgi:hypothetical protein